MRALGVMQGRLLPKYQGRYQAFPVGHWQEEFFIARQLGLDCIEFILDSSENPLLNQQGIGQIHSLVKETDVEVLTVCADYFMDCPLFALEKDTQRKSIEILMSLMRHASSIGVIDIIIPCVDQSSLVKDTSRIRRLVESLDQVLPLAESLGMHLALETDLTPKDFLELLKMFRSSAITVNYDTGNSASLGYDVSEEIETYGAYISTVHIKDRKKGGGSVLLGNGDADIGLVLTKLSQINFSGCIVLQAFRDDEGLAVFKQQLQWFKPVFEEHYSTFS